MKALELIKTLINSLLSLSIVATLLCCFISYTYTYHNPQQQEKYLIKYTQTPETNYIYTDNSNRAKKSAEMITSFINNLPKEVIADFTKQWKIIIAPNVSSDILIQTDGATSWEAKIIALNTHSDPTDTYNTFVHEFGHYFDLSHSYYSKSEDFNAIYEKYRDTYIELDDKTPKEYPTSSSLEFFASIFKEYFLYPEHLNQIAPDAYIYIDTIYKEAVTPKSDLETLIRTAKNNVIAFYRTYTQ